MNIKENILLYAKKNSIDKIGFCNTEPFYNVRTIILDRLKKGYLSGFEEKDIEKRIYPELTMNTVKSIIVIAESYNKNFKFEYDDKLRGNLSLSAIGKDYHIILKEKLESLGDYIKNFIENVEYKIFVDTGPLLDRELAKRSGIGWQGKNCSIITEEFGSWVFIGYMLINIEIEPDSIIDLHCGKCEKCILACPTSALKNNYEFNPKKCISYLTQTKDFIDEETSKKMGLQLYGCDICQKVCPYNKYSAVKETIYDIDIAMLDIEKLLCISNKDFKNIYGKTAIGWRGKRIIQRNASIVLKNLNN